MKGKIILLFLCLVIFLGIYFDQKNLLTENSFIFKSKNTSQKEISLATLTVNDKTYAYAFFSVENLNSVRIINNLLPREDTETVIKNHSCQAAVNAGFYSKDFQPLGALVIEKNVIQKATANNLLNGFLIIAQTAEISDQAPTTSEAGFIVQSGPLLVWNFEPLSLTLTDDKYSRRMIAAEGEKKPLIFLTVFEKESVFSGPELSELPVIIQKISEKENLKIVNALNLDGGSASMFKNKDLYLSEYKTVGEVICVK